MRDSANIDSVRRLNPDMISLDPNTAVHNLVTEEMHFFHEGSSMRKIRLTI